MRASVIPASLLMVALATTTARADLVCGQQVCSPYAQLRADLAERFGERLQWRRISSNGTVVEFWRNPDRDSWTVVRIHPNGRACGIAAGGSGTTTEQGT